MGSHDAHVSKDCKISHLEVHCSRQILCTVELPKAIEVPRRQECPSWLFLIAANWCGLGGGGGVAGVRPSM